MKKIMMTKFGFVRSPEDDFSDDGNRFTCYKVGNLVRVSKLVSDGWVYIDGSIRKQLPYNMYSKLPHYVAIGRLNGIKLETLTEDMLSQLYADCLAFEQEYEAAMQSLVYPTEDEIHRQCEKVQYKAKLELIDIEHQLNGKVVHLAKTLPEWQWKTIREYINNIHARVINYDPAVVVPRMKGTVASIEFCRPDNSNLSDSYYYTHIIELINK